MKKTQFLMSILLPVFTLLAGCREDPEMDANPPSVILNSPAQSSIINEAIWLEPQITDESGIKKVVFLIDTVPVFTDDTAPYKYLWNAGYWADGQTHSLQVIAWDEFNNEGSSTVILVSVSSNAKIKIQLLSPVSEQSFSLDTQIDFAWKSVSDGEKYEFELSQNLDFNPLIKSVSSADTTRKVSGLPAGTYYWRVRAETGLQRFSEWSGGVKFFVRPPVWRVSPGREFADWANGLAIGENGEVYVAGPSRTDTLTQNSSSYDILVYNLDGAGKTLWNKVFLNKDVDYGNSVEMAQNGDILVCGGSINPSRQIRVIRMSSTGNVIWNRSYGNQDSTSWGIKILRVPGQDRYFIGGEFENDPGVLIINGSGDVESFLKFPSKQNFLTLSLAHGFSNDILAYYGSSEIESGAIASLNYGGTTNWVTPIDATIRYIRRVARLTEEGGLGIIYRDKFSDEYVGLLNTSGSGINWKVKSESGIEFHGISDFRGEGVVIAGTKQGMTFVRNFSYSGELIWSKTGESGVLTNIFPNSGNGFYLTGFTSSVFTNNSSDFLIIKTTSNLEIDEIKESGQTGKTRAYFNSNLLRSLDPYQP